MPHLYINELGSLGSGNGLSPVQRQAITWTNVDLLSIRPFWTNFSEIQIKIQDFSFMKMHLKMLSVKWWPFCPGEMSWISLRWMSGHLPNEINIGLVNGLVLSVHTHAFPVVYELIHWGLHKMAAILQMTFFNLYSWIKIVVLNKILNWSLQNFSHVIRTVLLCYMQKIIGIWWPRFFFNKSRHSSSHHLNCWWETSS